MINKHILVSLLFVPAVLSCRQKLNGSYDYTSLQVDTSKIHIFNWDTTLYIFPKFSEPLALTNDDIKLVDSLLIDAIQKFNQTNSLQFYDAFNKKF